MNINIIQTNNEANHQKYNVVQHIAFFLLFNDINCLETVENIESHICVCHKLVSYFYFYIFAAYVSALDLDKLSKTLKLKLDPDCFLFLQTENFTIECYKKTPQALLTTVRLVFVSD